MRRLGSCFVGIVLLSLFVMSCKEIVLPEVGKRVTKVTYTADMIEESGSEQFDFQVRHNSKAIILPPVGGATTRVSTFKPVRRGYEFQYWTDGINQYQPGDAFTEDTYVQSDGSVVLEAVFTDRSGNIVLDPKYWKESLSTMFTITPQELITTGLREHQVGAVLGTPITETSDSIPVNFVNFPGGYVWKVNTYSYTGAHPFDSYKDTRWYNDVVGLNQGLIGDTPIVEDFALAETELTGGLFQLVYKWNIDKKKGYNLDYITLDNSYTSNMLLAKYILSGLFWIYTNSEAKVDRLSAYDPACGFSFPMAVVTCNMITQWYNEVKKPHDAPPLTFAYTKDGRSCGSDASSSNLIKDVNDRAISTIGRRTVVGSSFKETNTYSHVKGATGFRLPTSAEWKFAATVNPKNDTTNYGTYYQTQFKTPSMIDTRYTIGGKANATTTDVTYNFAVCSETHGKEGEVDKGTAVVKGDRLPNAVGLYDMNGNVGEISEGLSYSSSSNHETNPTDIVYVPILGANVSQSAADQRASYVSANSYTFPSYSSGIRLCRTTATHPVIL